MNDGKSQVDSIAIYGDSLNVFIKDQNDQKIIFYAESIKAYLKRNDYKPYPDFFLNLNFVLLSSYTKEQNYQAISVIFPELNAREDCITAEHIVLYNILLQQISDAYTKLNEPLMADSVANLGMRYLTTFNLKDEFNMAEWYPLKSQIAENQFRYQLAESYLLEYCKRIESLELPIKVFKSSSYRRLAEYYIRTNKFSKAEEAINNGLKFILTREDSLSDYHTTLLLLNMDCLEVRNQLEAIRSTAEKIEYIVSKYNEDDINKYLTLINIADYYLALKDINKAKSLFNNGINSLKLIAGSESLLIVNSQSYFALSLSEYEPIESIRLYEEIIEISKRKNYLDVLKDSYNRLCLIYYRKIKDYSKALTYSNLFFSIVDSKLEDFKTKWDVERQVSALANGSFLLSNSKEYEQSLKYDLQIIRLCEKYFDENNNRKKTVLQSVSNTYSYLNKIPQALEYLYKWYAAINQNIDENFTSFLFSADKEEKYLHDYEMFTEKIQRFKNQGIDSLGLNLHLKTKSIQQSYFSNLIRSSWSNPSLRIYVNEYFTISDNESQMDKIQRKIELENILFRNQVQSKNLIDYAGLKHSLKENEAIIEFGSYNYVYSVEREQFSHKYFCYIIKQNDSIPTFVDLGFQIQLDSLVRRNSNKIEKFYNYNFSIGFNNLFLNPILQHLNGIEDLIISPIGFLYNLNFSLLPIDSTTVLGDKFDIRLISNSYSILNKKAPSKPHVLYLFGGLDYDAKTNNNSVLSQNKSYASVAKVAPENISNYRWSYLEGSLDEINSITSLFKKKMPQIKVQKLTGQLGTEIAFRSLEYKEPFILHLATHGFSIPTNFESKRTAMLRTKLGKLSEDESPKSNSILHSGFVLSGANLTKDSSANNESDGIVLAEDINFLNFTNCELLVLSACKTGIGSIKNNEGVFGLGRSFKISGVKNIIVSQWEIPDKETSELFGLFYNELLDGKTYRKALFNAQMLMKSRYDDPYLWAGFLLIE